MTELSLKSLQTVLYLAASKRDFLLRAGSVALATSFGGWDSVIARSYKQSTFRLQDFGISGDIPADVSTNFQAALDKIGDAGGGILICPAGVTRAKDLVVPNNVIITGAGVGVTTIKLPDRANTDLIRQSGYADDRTFANLNFGLRDLTLDGNKARNDSGHLLALRGYRAVVERVQFTQAAGHGVFLTERSLNGVENMNGLGENIVSMCFFDHCNGAGVYASNGPGNKISDMIIRDSIFNDNGRNGFYQIDLERSAGFHITSNHMYRGGLGDVRAMRAGALIVANNNFDGTDNRPRDGIIRQVEIEIGGWGNIIVTGNLFHAHRAPNRDVHEWRQLEIGGSGAGAISVTGNSFLADFVSEVAGICLTGRTGDNVIISGNSFGGSSRGKVLIPE